MHISHGSSHEIIHNGLGFHDVSARWVPKQLTVEQKFNRSAVSRSLLNGFHHEFEAF
jgi:hypothetical protein